METSIPFQGFYNSIHDSECDHALEQMFSDRRTGCHPNNGLEAQVHRTIDWRQVQTDYAQEYAENFADEFKLPTLKFTEMQSPREYNFTTDRIFCDISLEDVQRLWNETNTPALRTLARDKFTSRSGFSSFYDPDIDTWGPLEGWDLNQVGTLIEAYADQETNSSDGFDSWAEYHLMESSFGNGFLEDAISGATPNIARLYAVHDYLETRADRERAHA